MYNAIGSETEIFFLVKDGSANNLMIWEAFKVYIHGISVSHKNYKNCVVSD